MYRPLILLCAVVSLGHSHTLVKRQEGNDTDIEYYDYDYDNATTEEYGELYEYYETDTEPTVTTAPLQQGGVVIRGENGGRRQPNRRKNNNRRRNNRRGNGKKKNKNNNRGNNRGNNKGGKNKRRRRPNRCRRKNKRRCRRPNQTNKPPKTTTPKPTAGPHEDIIKQISWKDKINNGGLMIIEEGGHQQFYSLGFDETNKHLGICFQSDSLGGSSGVCRYLKYCMDPIYLTSYVAFFDNKCITANGFVGVCCKEGPEPLVTEKPTTGKPEKFLSNCGQNVLQRTRIVGGQAADPQEYPWMAALIAEERPGVAKSFCGGVLITDRHVLSASHCLLGTQPRDFKIRLGEYDFSKKGDTAHRDFDIEKITMHELYNTRDQRNDIAIITLANSTEYNDDIFPICLPAEDDVFEGQPATVVGWGTLRYAGDDSDILREVVLPVWNLNECNSTFLELQNPIVSTQICAGVEEGGKDSCQGDSGGPLMYFDMSTLQWKVIGVVSYGYFCATPGFPGIYTRVTSYLPWIYHIVDST